MSYIYAIECNGRIKIGFSVDPSTRFSKIASDAPYPCRLIGCWRGTPDDEKAVHEQFESLRVHGEWFLATAALFRFIEGSAIFVGKKPGKRTTVLETDSKLTAWRKRAGMRQQDMANELGITVGFVSQLESGNSKPSLETLARIVKLTNGEVSVADFTSEAA